MPIAVIAERAGVPRAVVYQLLGSSYGGRPRTRRVRPETEQRLLDVHPDVSVARTPRNANPPDAWGLDLEAPLPPGTDLTWRARGACRAPDIPTRVFFPGRGDIETVGAARAICAGCVVRQPCLDFALTVGAEGVWGGTTRQERESMLGRRYNKRRDGETTAAAV